MCIFNGDGIKNYIYCPKYQRNLKVIPILLHWRCFLLFSAMFSCFLLFSAVFIEETQKSIYT